MLYEDYTAKLLGLEDVIIKKVWEDESAHHIELELPRRKHICPCCGAETDRIHDYRKQKIKDISAFGKDVYLYLRKRRYVCDGCGKRFYEKKALLNKPPNKLKEDEREKLRIILGLSTRLEQAYFLKNDFLFLMHSPNSEVAEDLLTDWIYRAESSHLPEFRECTRAIHNWGKLILNSFDVPFTNGFTEGCNNKTKVLKRVCYGVRNFPRFRNRILHCAS